MTKINIPLSHKPKACGNKYLGFFCCPRGLQYTGEPGEMRLGSFCNKSAENSLFAHVLITRSGYYSKNELYNRAKPVVVSYTRTRHCVRSEIFLRQPRLPLVTMCGHRRPTATSGSFGSDVIFSKCWHVKRTKIIQINNQRAYTQQSTTIIQNKRILHMYLYGTKKFHQRTRVIRQKWGSVEFLTKLFWSEEGLSFFHTNT